MKHLVLTILAISILSFTQAQDYKFGNVSKEEVANNVYEKDTSAGAVILYKYRNTYFDHDHPDGYIVITEVHERVKILNKDGLDYATKKIRSYNYGKNHERISGIKGYTYNIENGKLNDEKLRKDGIFEERLSDYWEETSFTMPNVKVGSVVEWTYRKTSPLWGVDDLIIQEDIPTKHYYAKIELLSYFNFNLVAKGRYMISPKQYEELRNLNVNYEQSTNGALTQATKSATVQTKEYVSEYELRDVPALSDEPYVDNKDNYRALVTYELASVQFPGGQPHKYSNTWEEVVKTINESDNFGKELENTKFLKDDADQIKTLGTAPIELVKNAFEFVKNKMNWNGSKSVGTSDGIRKAYKENTGNSAQINLMLTALLRECGIKANPVLVSTRDHGFPVFPTLDGFNYVVVCAEVGGKTILLDATDKLSSINVLPQRVLNWEGTIVYDDGAFKKINMYPIDLSEHNTIMSITINDDGSLSGKQNSSYSDLDAMAYRKKYETYSKDEYIDALINRYTFDDLTEFEVKNDKDLSKSIIEGYSFEINEGVDMVGNEIYFSPLFFHRLTENPFKLKERNFPVNFVYASREKKMINIKIPEGYQVTSTPEPIKISLPDQMGSFLFNISVTEGGLNVISTFEINSAIIPEFKYAELKEFYNQRVLKETEKVVLTKM
jgi:hypothetical protein